MYGAVMGLAGLGLSARAAATVFPGFLRAPAYFTEPWVALGALLLAVLLPLYLLKLFKFPAAVREDFTNPATLGFCGALPVGMTLVAGGIAPYSALTGNLLWEAGCALLLAFQILALVRWLSGVVLAIALLVYARNFMRWPFAPSWWAFTFPLDALAYAAARYAQGHPSPPWRLAAAAALAVATLFVVVALWKTARSAASRAA